MQDQWQRKKQTKEQARAARRAKLDPMNAKSVKDVMDANDQKRKRDESEDRAMNGANPEKPREGLKTPKPDVKKRKKDDQESKTSASADSTEAPAAQRLKAEKAERKQAKKERKQAAQAEKRESKRQRREEKAKRRAGTTEAGTGVNDAESTKSEDRDGAMESSEFGGLSEGNADGSGAASNTSHSSKDQSPIFDGTTVQSGTSSISSVLDPVASTTEKLEDLTTSVAAKPTQEELQVRLQKRLAELRAARKADKEDGTPTITRQQLLEQRREKEAQRKAHKKALRKEAKEAERVKKEAELAHGSPLMSPSIGSPAGKHASPLGNPANNFAFGKIAFDNGQTMTAKLDGVLDPRKKAAPHNPKLALEAAERRTAKLAALDPAQRAQAAAKEMWRTANQRASGERVRDDVSLLKKTLKRKETQKKKSGKEWDARLKGIAQAQEARQKKREENLQARKENKGAKGKKKKPKPKPKARPGFEGSFRAGGGKPK